jgi:hypothetical protein
MDASWWAQLYTGIVSPPGSTGGSLMVGRRLRTNRVFALVLHAIDYMHESPERRFYLRGTGIAVLAMAVVLRSEVGDERCRHQLGQKFGDFGHTGILALALSRSYDLHHPSMCSKGGSRESAT